LGILERQKRTNDGITAVCESLIQRLDEEQQDMREEQDWNWDDYGKLENPPSHSTSFFLVSRAHAPREDQWCPFRRLWQRMRLRLSITTARQRG